MEYPRLRFVDAFPIETEDGQRFALRDPSGIATETLVLSPNVFFLLQFFDGKHSRHDIKVEYTKTYGAFMSDEQLDEIIEYLNKHLFLDNQHFTKKLSNIEQSFVELPSRPAIHAGSSYEAQPDRLKEQIDGFFVSPEGAGFPNGNHGKEVKGLIAPHIDIRAGGACYTHAYKTLYESGGADCFVIMGTGHSGLHDLYSVISKDFDTPFGKATCDRDFVELLTKNYPRIAQSEVLPHKSEHVIEFQLVFLKHLYEHLFKDGRDFTFVPVLCSFSYHMLTLPEFSREKRIISEFSKALKKTIAESGKKVCLVASVDFSHVGLRYGDSGIIDEQFLSRVNAFEKNMIATIEDLDPEAFCRTVASQQDRYRVCGFSSIYTMLQSMDAKEGKLLDHAKTEVDGQRSTVTFASMAFH